jgi:hypothetical protein
MGLSFSCPQDAGKGRFGCRGSVLGWRRRGIGAGMTIFEHLSVLLSLILSLGIASLLLGVARLCQEWRRVTFSWPHALWTLAIFLAQILFWLFAFSFHTFAKTSVIGLAVPLVMVTAVFLQGALVTPAIPETGPINLGAFHDAHRFQYLGAAAVYYLLFEAWTFHIAQLLPLQASSYAIPVVFLTTTVLALAFKARSVQVIMALVQIALQLAQFPFLVVALNRG